MREKYIRFGDFINKKRQEHPDELTLKEVSKMLGISLSFLSDVENNRRKPEGLGMPYTARGHL